LSGTVRAAKRAPSTVNSLTWQGYSLMSGNMKRPKTTPSAAGPSADGDLAPVAIVEFTARYRLSIVAWPDAPCGTVAAAN
jgi:hypothetical protein